MTATLQSHFEFIVRLPTVSRQLKSTLFSLRRPSFAYNFFSVHERNLIALQMKGADMTCRCLMNWWKREVFFEDRRDSSSHLTNVSLIWVGKFNECSSAQKHLFVFDISDVSQTEWIALQESHSFAACHFDHISHNEIRHRKTDKLFSFSLSLSLETQQYNQYNKAFLSQWVEQLLQ